MGGIFHFKARKVPRMTQTAGKTVQLTHLVDMNRVEDALGRVAKISAVRLTPHATTPPTDIPS